MHQGLFIWAVTSYLISLGGSLLLSFFHNRISPALRYLFIGLHLLPLILYFFFIPDQDSLLNPGPGNYLFLAFFCLGALFSGVVLRSQSPPLLKIYFAVFPLSAIAFFISPSFLIGFISTGDPGARKPEDFRLYDNVYLVPQQSTSDPDGHGVPFKITREMGVFHKTLVRDIFLPSWPDSVSGTPSDDQRQVRLNIMYKCSSGWCKWDSTVTFGQKDSSKMIIRKPSGKS